MIASVIFVTVAIIMPKTLYATITSMTSIADFNHGTLNIAMTSFFLSAFMGAEGSLKAISTITVLKSRTLAESKAEALEEARKVFSRRFVNGHH
ncbi:MAG: hypothetical protein K9N35_07305 [Candidatus Marinimicrobia bacterium]|nr:hypothetical protein [Candidatus Neomarinimicrobiota bacterium]